MKNDKIIKIVERAGGLAETNSSSSHALSICSSSDYIAKPGDPEFDLDIRDNILYVPERQGEFGWEYEKSNQCELKLQYVCGLVFNSWSPLYSQKEPKKLEIALKKYLGVSKVVFEWEEKYLESWKKGETSLEDGPYLPCPEIDHQSRSDSREEILESEETMINFIFNKKSWYFGGNDNSEAPKGFYNEVCTSTVDSPGEPNATLSLYYGGDIGRVDFRVNMLVSSGLSYIDFIQMIEESDDFYLFRTICFTSSGNKFSIADRINLNSGEYLATADMSYVDPKTNKAYVVYLTREGTNELMELLKTKGVRRFEMSTKEIVDSLSSEHVILIPIKLVSDEFGDIYLP